MLEAKNIYKKFGDKTVLKNVNLNIEKGETVLIIGPSGSGKTTILKCLNMLITPDKGEIIFKNEKLTEENINKIREKVGMVFQSFNLFPHLTILKNLTLVPVKKKLMTEKEAVKKAKELLKKFGILDKQNEYPDNLSGGQKQRVAITRALMMNPEILLFDEPTSALDPEMVDEVFDSIEMLSKSGMTIVIVSHEMRFIQRLNPKIVFINKGKIEKIGTYEECKKMVSHMEDSFKSDVFGVEKENGKVEGILAAVYQSVFGGDVYPSLEEKAANLLYFMIKDHPYADGCKRIAASLFLEFLARNNALYRDDSKIISDGALVAIMLMIAESRPEEKDIMVNLVMNFLTM